jgi:hypothetical protein
MGFRGEKCNQVIDLLKVEVYILIVSFREKYYNDHLVIKL